MTQGVLILVLPHHTHHTLCNNTKSQNRRLERKDSRDKILSELKKNKRPLKQHPESHENATDNYTHAVIQYVYCFIILLYKSLTSDLATRPIECQTKECCGSYCMCPRALPRTVTLGVQLGSLRRAYVPHLHTQETLNSTVQPFILG